MPGMHGMDGVAPPAVGRMVDWAPEPFFLTCCLIALALYGAGVVTLVRRGDRWPVGRTIAWVLGVLTILAVTCTGLGTYGMYLFSVHMAQHMVLSMLSPLLLLCGAPVTLALRALHAAPRGRTGPRELLVALLHSRFAMVISSPVFTLPVFVASLYGLYFTSLFDTLMGSTVGHAAMLVHFLTVGLLFFWPLMGIDPAPHRPGYVLRLLELFVGMPFHAFFGVATMSSASLITTAFAHPPADWHIDPLNDQKLAGGLAWSFSEVPTLIVVVVVFVLWLRAEGRVARRHDRAAARAGGDTELAAYNDFLASLHRADQIRAERAARTEHPTPRPDAAARPATTD